VSFTSLAYHIDLRWLHEAYKRTRKDGAVGVDGQTAEETAKERLHNLEQELKVQESKEEQLNALQLVIGRMKEFSEKVTDGLHEADWSMRREIVRAMVKEIRIDEEEVKILYKVSPDSPGKGPKPNSLQHCWRRGLPDTQ
jgi:site-specific DNA recombinase